MAGDKITIISVDLGATIDTIINESSTKLSKDTENAIDAAIEEQRKDKEVKEMAKNKKKKQDEEITAALDKAYALLFGDGETFNSVSATRIIAATTPAVTTLLSFVGRMRSYLKQRGNEYRMSAKKVRGETQYTLHPYNKED